MINIDVNLHTSYNLPLKKSEKHNQIYTIHSHPDCLMENDPLVLALFV